MSAFVCDREHIAFLVKVAMERRLNPPPNGPLRWSWNEGGEFKTGTLAQGDYVRAAEVGNMLWEQNLRSVLCRYPSDNRETMPGPIGENFKLTPLDFARPLKQVDLAQVFKSCHCYEYQACEDPEWERSEAHAYLYSLMHRAQACIPGYESAQWGGPKA